MNYISTPRMHNKGFTLIELLVVVAIIGLLSAVTLASLTVARRRAIDASITQDVKQLQNAAELYYLSNRSFPVGDYTSMWSPSSGVIIDDSGLSTALLPFIKTMPRIKHLEPTGLFVFFGADSDPTYRCGTSDYTPSGAPKYIILFTSYYPLNLPTASEDDGSGVISYYNGLNGSPRYYCVTAK
jgi:prepilin-type N-terminal cleavage/methylation domain-containing protein